MAARDYLEAAETLREYSYQRAFGESRLGKWKEVLNHGKALLRKRDADKVDAANGNDMMDADARNDEEQDDQGSENGPEAQNEEDQDLMDRLSLIHRTIPTNRKAPAMETVQDILDIAQTYEARRISRGVSTWPLLW